MHAQTLPTIVFAVYALLIFSGGMVAVTARNLVRALLGLIATLFGVAGMYMLMNAPFLALMQLLIYVGAVSVLIFFAIMLTKAPVGAEEGEERQPRKHIFAALATSLPALVLGGVILTHEAPGTMVPTEVSIKTLGQGLMEPYVLAFELISVVLFVAMSGAVLLGFERRKL